MKANINSHKARLKGILREKLSTRWHMTLICLITICGGTLFSKLLLFADVSHPAKRYFCAVVFAYALFFLLIKLWMHFHFDSGSHTQYESSLDAVDALDAADIASHTVQYELAESKGVLEDVSSAADADEFWVLVLFIAVIAAVLGSSAYLIYQAPEILLDAALDGVLVASLVRGARQAHGEGWALVILKKTWIPFAIVLIIASVLGAVIKHNCPEARSFHEFMDRCRK